MRKTMMYLFLMMTVLLMAAPVYAQGGASANPPSWAIFIGAGLGMGVAAGLCGLGQGKATGSAVEAMARNPGARPGIFIFLLLGLALIESLALYMLVIAFKMLPS